MSCTAFENKPRPRHPVTVEEHTPGTEVYVSVATFPPESARMNVCSRCGTLYDPKVDVIGVDE